MTASIQNEQVQALCILAENDQTVLDFALPDDIFGFHAQQSAEKLLKALITAHGQKYPFVHKLDKLVTQVATCGEHLPPLPYSLLRLNPYAVEFRYEAGDPVSTSDRDLIRQSVQILHDFVITRVLALQTPQP